MTTLMRGNFWVNIDRHNLKSNKIEESDIIFKFQEYARSNSIQIFQIEYIPNDKYVCFYTISSRTKDDCRSYRDILKELLMPLGKVKSIQETFERIKEL